MVKKKFFSTGGNKEKNNTETTENKDNTTAQDTEETDHAEVTSGSESEAVQAEPAAGVKEEADKNKDEQRVILEKLAEMQDKYLRLSAEFDNYRKRTLKEKMDISKYGGEEVLKDILPVIDDFDRALKHMESSENCEGIKEGVMLIYNKLIEYLKRNGVSEIPAINEAFNVDLHDATARIQVQEEAKKGKVVEVLLKGYYLKDKILRHSKVVIGD
ncbi:MAG: nucleotide exchange factor GrpE [Bacteroidales bacterium]|jgi:molecular chaperone GrpE|nr:nucleotide exchange factor GrpE [Bacteroidales bacterium]